MRVLPEFDVFAVAGEAGLVELGDGLSVDANQSYEDCLAVD